jgi:hypothetical protein
MHFSKTLVCGVAALAANTLVAAAPIKRSDISSGIIPPADLKEEIESSASAADSANIEGQIEDSGLFDDLERLLDIIGNHVDRMRGEGGASSNNNGFSLKGHNDSDKDDDKASHQDNKPVLAKELEHKGAASPAPADSDAAALEPATEAEPGFPPFQGAPGPSIFDPPSGGDSDFPNSLHHNDGGDNNNDHQQQQPESHPAPNFPEVTEPAGGGGDHGFTNITCKGISVCNPVTVFHEKGANKKGKGKGVWSSLGNWGGWGKTAAEAEGDEARDEAAAASAEAEVEQQQHQREVQEVGQQQ